MSTEAIPLIGKKRPKLTGSLALATMVACFGSVQYGYHMAELNAPQLVLSCSKEVNPWPEFPYEKTWLGKHGLVQCIPLTEEQIGLVTSIFSIGGLIGSLYAGKIADIYGRKPISFVNSILGILGSLILFASNTYAQMLLGRFVAGVCCGSAIVITPLIINEVSPRELRGSLGSMNQVCINVGILITQLLALRLADSYRWRWLLFTGALLALANFALLFKVNESPLWLASRGELAAAESVICNLRGGDVQRSRQEVREWLDSRGQSGDDNCQARTRTGVQTISGRDQSLTERRANDVFQSESRATSTSSLDEEVTLTKYIRDPRYALSRRAITAILMGQQFCGINSIIFYGVKVISDLVPGYAILINVAISVLNVVATFGASFLVDHWGRKPLLILSSSSMSVAAAFISLGIVTMRASVLVTFTFIYIGVFALGVGPIPFLVIPELSPPDVVGVAQSYGTTCNWIATFMVGYGFPILRNWLAGYVFLVFAVIAACFASYIYYMVPETKGKKDYEEIWGVRD
ncbi:LAFE_0C06128g1_1 [Lachancea fermentati]|uniref:LAFE_0C06128g1_1 n=1 Tax=Lachancea fermentati TaxID=4955 RepID=A0A1G4M9J7_LACFM|nr:LAFE_0C06128g1_1 [Lachancea fermentati]